MAKPGLAGSPRRRLSREQAVRAAINLADRDGIEAVSMRRLADALGVVPMAMYKHVVDKEDLLDAMVDLVVADYEEPPQGLAWRDEVRARIVAARRSLLAHPWLRPVIETRARRTPAILGHMDALAGAFLAGGCSADLTHHAMHALGHRIWGFSPEAFQEATPVALPDDPDERDAFVRRWTEAYPNIVAIARTATDDDLDAVGTGCDEEFEFDFALDVLLDAFERLRMDGWRSTG